MSSMNDILSSFDDLGPSIAPRPKGGAKPPQLAAWAAPSVPKVPVQHVPCVVFHPAALTLHEEIIDIANPEIDGTWYATPQGAKISKTFIAGPEAKASLEDCIAQVSEVRISANKAIALLEAEIVRITEAAHKAENQAVGKMFVLARQSRVGLFAPAEPPK